MTHSVRRKQSAAGIGGRRFCSGGGGGGGGGGGAPRTATGSTGSPLSVHDKMQQTVISFGSGAGKVDLSLAEIFGHSSFMLLATSFAFGDILWLRSLALASGSCMAVFNYWHPNGRVLWLPFRWNLIFIIVNSMWILQVRKRGVKRGRTSYMVTLS